MPETVFDCIARRAGETPVAIALQAFGQTPLTYARLRDHVLSVVEELNRFGVGRNDRVAIVLPHSPEMATACLAVTAGAVAVPLNPEYRGAEYEAYLSSLRPQALLTEWGLESPARAAALSLGIPILELSRREDSQAGLFDLRAEVAPAAARSGGLARPEDLALVLHTSGTTSLPKRVPLTQRNLAASAQNLIRSLELGAGDRCLHMLAMFHIGGVLDVLAAPLIVGGSVVCTSGFSIPEFYQGLGIFRPTWSQAVPIMLQEILAQAEHHRDIVEQHSLRFMRSVSAPLPPPVMREFERVFRVPVIEIFGMTESAGVISSNPLPPGERKSGSVGVPAGTEVAIMDAAGALLRDGRTGEVVIRGENVMSAYEDAPEDNARAFSGPWFRTGDQGHLDENGYLFLTGRFKEIINRGGEKISPREVDEVLLAHPDVAECATFAMPHASLGEDVAAAVVLKKGSVLGKAELIEHLKERLAYFKVPRLVHFLEAIPKGPGGKVQRVQLAQQLDVSDADAARRTWGYQAPETPVAKMLAEMWSRVLQFPRIGIHDDFFGLGGDSLKAASLVNELQQRWGGTVYVSAVFDAPSIARFEGHLQQHYPEVFMRMVGQYVSARAAVSGSRVDVSKVARIRQSIARPAGAPKAAGAKNPPAVFILCPPRSGSTLLRAMLGGHPRLFAPPELYLLGFHDLADRKAWFSGSQRFQLEGNTRAVMQLRHQGPDEAQRLIEELEGRKLPVREYYHLMQGWLGERILVDKTPSYAIHVATLERAEEYFESPMYLHLLRHPYGMIRSFEEAKLEQLWYPRLVGTREAQRTPCPYESRELAEMIWLILHQNILRFLEGIPPRRQRRLQFEEMVVDPRRAMEEVCGFLGVGFDPAMLEPRDSPRERMTDGLHPVSRMIGDMKFHQHQAIAPEVADRWKEAYDTDFLSEETWKLAVSLGYDQTLAKARNRREFEL